MTQNMLSSRDVLNGGRALGRVVVGLVALLVLDRPGESQGPEWRRAPAVVPISTQTIQVAAYDEARGVVVLLMTGEWGTGLWEWVGSRWIERDQGLAVPPFALGAKATFDHATGEVLVYGGCAGSSWSWNGRRWLQRSSSTPPPCCAGAASMASDRIRRRTVLYGVGRPAGPGTDTWEWDGSQWTNISIPASQRPPDYPGMMAFDLQTGRMVVVCEGSGTPTTWLWEGTRWTAHSGATPWRRRAFVVADTLSPSPRVLLHGGYDINGDARSDTWQWHQGSWQPLLTRGTAPRLCGQVAVFDQGAGMTLLSGATWGWINDDVRSEHWVLAPGDTWTLRVEGSSPTWSNVRAILRPNMAFDTHSGTTVLLDGGMGRSTQGAPSGNGEMWRFDGVHWEQIAATNLPPWRGGAAFAYDSVRRHFVLFGGDNGTTRPNYLNDTWIWDGTTWTQQFGSPSPPPFSGAKLVEDQARGGLLLVAGSELWKWTGAGWVALGMGPAGGLRWAVAYDTWRSVLVAQTYQQLAEWDGTTWRQSALPGPLLNQNSRMVFDDRRGVCVLLGVDQITARSETWEYDPRTRSWTRTSVDVPWAFTNFALSYDSWRGQTVLFGGHVTATWLYGAGNLSPSLQELALGAPLDLSLSLPSDPGCWFVGGLALGAEGGIPVSLAGRTAVWPLAPDRMFRITFGLPQLIGRLDAAGSGSVRLPLPADPGLGSLFLCASAVTLDPVTLGLRSITRDVRAFIRPP